MNVRELGDVLLAIADGTRRLERERFAPLLKAARSFTAKDCEGCRDSDYSGKCRVCLLVDAVAALEDGP